MIASLATMLSGIFRLVWLRRLGLTVPAPPSQISDVSEHKNSQYYSHILFLLQNVIATAYVSYVFVKACDCWLPASLVPSIALSNFVSDLEISHQRFAYYPYSVYSPRLTPISKTHRKANKRYLDGVSGNIQSKQ